MNKRDLIDATHEDVTIDGLELSRNEVSQVIETMFDVIDEAMYAGEAVLVSGVVKFTPIDVAAKPRRKGVNPFTGESAIFKAKPATTRVRVTAMKRLKESAAAGRRARARRAA